MRLTTNEVQTAFQGHVNEYLDDGFESDTSSDSSMEEPDLLYNTTKRPRGKKSTRESPSYEELRLARRLAGWPFNAPVSASPVVRPSDSITVCEVTARKS